MCLPHKCPHYARSFKQHIPASGTSNISLGGIPPGRSPTRTIIRLNSPKHMFPLSSQEVAKGIITKFPMGFGNLPGAPSANFFGLRDVHVFEHGGTGRWMENSRALGRAMLRFLKMFKYGFDDPMWSRGADGRIVPVCEEYIQHCIRPPVLKGCEAAFIFIFIFISIFTDLVTSL